MEKLQIVKISLPWQLAIDNVAYPFKSYDAALLPTPPQQNTFVNIFGLFVNIRIISDLTLSQAICTNLMIDVLSGFLLIK